jgi:hypothetical protein
MPSLRIAVFCIYRKTLSRFRAQLTFPAATSLAVVLLVVE